jgi:hypothetical protein
MTYFFNNHRGAGLIIGCAATLLMTACASQPDRRGPGNGDRERGDRPAQSRQSGVFLHPISAIFISMDSNKDKVTSRAEMQSGVQMEWASFETAPSAITFAQWSVASLGSSDANPGFMRFDRDFNGIVSEDEFKSEFERSFDRADKNKDGRLERSEMTTEFAAQQGRRNQGSENGGGRGQRGGGGGGRPPR